MQTPAPGKPTVFVIDDDASIRRGLSRLLRAGSYHVELFESAEAFLKRERFDGVGCIILDLCMPGIDGIALQDHQEAHGGDLPIIFLSGHGDIPTTVAAMKKGAVDFLTKPVDESALLPAVADALQRHALICSQRAVQDTLRQRLFKLTCREREVMEHLLTGAANKKIAVRLGIAEKTVKAHRARVMEKLQVSSIAELVHLCSLLGVARPDDHASVSRLSDSEKQPPFGFSTL